MTTLLYQADAFTDTPFRGNPAAVCLLDGPREEDWMRSLAAEMNLSETAFLLPEGDGYRLRWFTPRVEVSLCGHATLASAHILWEQGFLPTQEPARFETLSGRLTAHSLPGGWIGLDFPAQPPSPADAPEGLLAALGVSEEQVRFVGRYKNNTLVELDREQTVRSLTPDFERLEQVETRAVSVTAMADDPQLDFVSRFFAPRMGINEDPVTGSAHTALTPFWSAITGKPELEAMQVSARGGRLRLRALGERVAIAGQAVTIFSARLA